MASSSSAFAHLPIPLQRAVIGLMMQLRQPEQAQIVQFQAPLEALADAMTLLSDEEEAADAVSLVLLPVYTLLTLPFSSTTMAKTTGNVTPTTPPLTSLPQMQQQPLPQQQQHAHRTPAEAKALAAALRCVSGMASKCGSSIIRDDPSIYLKVLTQLVMSLATLSKEDSTKRVEWWVEEKAVLEALLALLQCSPLQGGGRDQKRKGEERREEKRKEKDSDREEPAIPSLDDYLDDLEEEDEDAKEEAKAAALHRQLSAEAHWKEVARALVGAISGAIVAQLIQGLLDVIGRDRDRDMRLLALSCLDNLILRLLPCPDVWRPFFPGVFGGLIKVVLGDYKQGSRVMASALDTLLGVTAMLANVRLEASNGPGSNSCRSLRLLQQHEVGGGRGGGETEAKPPSSSLTAWQQFQALLLPPFPSSTPSSTASFSPHPRRYVPIPVPPQIQVHVTMQWGKELQRRLSDYLPVLLRACISSESVKVREVLVDGLARMVAEGEDEEGREGGGMTVNLFLVDLQEEVGEEEGRVHGVSAVAELLRVRVLDALVALRADDDAPTVARKAQRVLTLLLCRGGGTSGSRSSSNSSRSRRVEAGLVSTSRLLDRVEELLECLPGVAAAVSDLGLRTTLRLLRGYLELLLEGGREGGGEGGVVWLLRGEKMDKTMGALRVCLEAERGGGGLQVIDPLPSSLSDKRRRRRRRRRQEEERKGEEDGEEDEEEEGEEEKDEEKKAAIVALKLAREQRQALASCSYISTPAAPAGATPSSTSSTQPLGYYRQSFRHVRSEAVLEDCKSMLRLLGQGGRREGGRGGGRGGGGGGSEAVYLVVSYVMNVLKKGANQARRFPRDDGREGGQEGGEEGGESRMLWALERVPLVFIMNQVLLGCGGREEEEEDEDEEMPREKGIEVDRKKEEEEEEEEEEEVEEGKDEAMLRTLEAASRLFLEGLFLTAGGPWHLPTGQAASTAAWVEEDRGGGGRGGGGGGGRGGGGMVAMALDAHVGCGATNEGGRGREGGRGEKLARARTLPVGVLESNARLVALLVEGVGDCVEALSNRLAAAARKRKRRRAGGREGRKGLEARWARAQERCLMLSLYPLVEKLGDPHPLVRQAALTTLHRLARAQQQQQHQQQQQQQQQEEEQREPGMLKAVMGGGGGGGGEGGGEGEVGALLAANLDYLVEALCVRVHKSQIRAAAAVGRGGGGGVSSFPLAPAVLEALIARAGPTASLALVRELARVVLDVVDVEGLTLGPRYVYGMMRVLRVMAQAIPSREGGREGRVRKAPKATRVPAAAYWREKILEEFGSAKAKKQKEQEERGREGEFKASSIGTEVFFKEYHREKEEEKKKEEEAKEKEMEGKLEIEKLFPEAAAASARKGHRERHTENGIYYEEEDEEVGGREDEDDDGEGDKPTVEESLILEIIERSCYFLASPNLFIQHQSLAILRLSLLKLAPRRVVLLPTVHRVWPAVMARLRACAIAINGPTRRRPGQHEEDLDRSAAYLLSIEALEMISSLAGLCGDFLSFKFVEELWPVLRAFLEASASSSLATAEAVDKGDGVMGKRGLGKGGRGAAPSSVLPSLAGGGGGRAMNRESLVVVGRRGIETSDCTSALDTRQQQVLSPGALLLQQQQQEQERLALHMRAEMAVVRCLRYFMEAEDCYRYTVPLVRVIGQHCLFLLGRVEPGSERGREVAGLFEGLVRLDGAALWPSLMEAAGWDVSVRPPVRRAGREGGREGGWRGEMERKWAREHAEGLLKRVEGKEEGREEMAWCVSTG